MLSLVLPDGRGLIISMHVLPSGWFVFLNFPACLIETELMMVDK